MTVKRQAFALAGPFRALCLSSTFSCSCTIPANKMPGIPVDIHFLGL